MFLKSIEIRGFKSFADKTQLNFKEGVTAVVGPNGSGKSNVSDAVRWVLGEQSVKTLRGGKMEDVIFAGTQFRKPVGLAQVSLVLDNCDEALDTDYSEVMVTRRIFRSGETEYLINNQKCRLKDINNLFMDTGIGKEGYSIIGQGKIEAILSGKPEERRALLEEAAGIVKYKTRKEEAEKKLSNTEENLVRIRDIISTYEERIEPLRIEREKALKYKELADSLRIKEVSILTFQIENLEEDLKSINSEITLRKNKLSEKKEQLRLEKERLEKYNFDLEEIENKNLREKQEYYNKKDEVNNNSNNIEIFKERIKNLENIISKDLLEIKSLENSFEEIIKEKDLAKKVLEEKKEEQFLKNENIISLENEINVTKENINNIEKEIITLKDEEFDLLRRNSEINNNIIILNKDIKNKEELEVNGQESLKLLESNIKINLGTLISLNEKINKAKELKNEIELEIHENKKNLSSLKGNISRLEAKLKEKDKSINVLEGKLYTLKDLEKNYEGYQLSVKRLMERVEEGKVSNKNKVFLLGEIFKVDKKFETAIEISLAGGISNIITEDENTAKLLINYLKNNSLGRATFLPLNVVKGNKLNVAENIKNIEGYLGVASEIISFDEKFRGVMEYSLGKTIIADNMDTALEISKLGNHKIKIVTLEGEIISPGGALTGGSIYKKNNSSILGRKREVKELETNLNLIKEEYNNILNEVKILKEKGIQLDEINLNKNDELHINNIDIATFESEIKSLEKESLRLENSLEISKKEITINKEILSKLKESIKRKEEELNNLREIGIKNKVNINDLEKKLKDSNIKLNKDKEKLIEIKIYKATLDEIVSNKEKELKEKEKLEKEKNIKIEFLKKDNKEKEDNINYLKNQIIEKEKIINNLKVNLSSLEEIFKEDEIKRIKLKEDIKDKDNLVNEIQEVTRILDMELNKKEVQFAKIESEKDSYYKKLNDELNLTLAEAKEIAENIENIILVKEEIQKLKSKITILGIINLASIAEYEEVLEKYEFMANQEEDLNKAKEELNTVISEMTGKMKELFIDNFKILNENFNETFKELFKGGKAELILGDGDELSANIEINVEPPGKKLQNINLMSGGEKVLSAIALLFGILKMKPTPFCILDEIEAALDDANVMRYAEFLRKFSEKIQFIVITHRKGTMEASDVMYGITMEEKGISKVVSVDLNKNN